MQSSTYKDIIDEKIAEWRTGLQKIEEQANTASADKREMILEQSKQLKSAIDAAVVQLRELDAKETVNNTMETKDKILKIFSSIDKDFPSFEYKKPYML